MTEAIQVEGLTKVFTTTKDRPPLSAEEGIDFTVHEGEVFGFLGPNGAGKTSTIRLLTGLSRPTAGKARWRRHPHSCPSRSTSTEEEDIQSFLPAVCELIRKNGLTLVSENKL